MVYSTIERFLPVAAWACLILIAFVTLSPIQMRPVVTDIKVEHIIAFAVMAILFSLAYPRHTVLIILLAFGAAALLESLQLIVPGRHGRLLDMYEKWLGAGFGLIIAHLINRLLRG